MGLVLRAHLSKAGADANNCTWKISRVVVITNVRCDVLRMLREGDI